MAIEIDAGLERRFRSLVDRSEIRRPARIGQKFLPLVQHQFSKFFDAKVRDQELDPRPRAVALLAETGEDA